MRTVVYIVACVVVLSVISCTSRNRNGEDVQILMRDSTVVTAPQRMQVSDTKTTITYRGKGIPFFSCPPSGRKPACCEKRTRREVC